MTAEEASLATEATVAADRSWSAQLTAAWDVRGIDVGTIVLDEGTAVDHSRYRARKTAATLATLPSLVSKRPGASSSFEVGPILGEGGMGVVHLADQPALDRQVAVKVPRPEAGEEAVAALLREARVTGALEHPNVIPVYALGRDDDDRPLLVMKRVEGRSWEAVLSEATDEDRRREDYLQEQLEVLQRVALATHVAHLGGIIHRDLKPDNVMLGHFGEVYLVDWGIAVSTREDGIRDLPLARDVSAIEGTPGYMAPEMAAGEGSAIDERTDVYLLGAILHDLLTGQPPHGGKTLMETLTRAFASDPPTYPDHVPRDLQRIAKRAMGRLNEDRFESAAAFAAAIDEFRIHRGSTLLSDEARVRLEELKDTLATETLDGAQHEKDEEVWQTFAECRFAFGQALRSWPDNADGEAGLQEVLTLMIDLELGRGAPRAAAALLHELPRRDPELQARVDEALATHRAAQERLAKLERDANTSLGQRLKLRLAAISALMWGLLYVACGWLYRAETYDVGHYAFAGVNALQGAVVGSVAMLVFFKRGYANDVNVRLAKSAFIVFATYALLWVVGGYAEAPMHTVALLQTCAGVGLWTNLAVNVDRRWFPMPLCVLGSMVGVLAFPRYFFEAIGGMGALGTFFSSAVAKHGERTTSPE